MSIIKKLKDRIMEGSERTAKLKLNIVYMLGLKGGSILVSLLLVPLTLNYVDNETYGIWLALSSMVTWVHFFDIGINNGLKNKLTEAIARNDYILGQKYVSTTYAILTLIFVPIMVLLLLIVPFLNWSSILNLPKESAEGLMSVICILIVYFCINFILSTINIILQADQRPADASFRQFLQQFTSLVIIYILTVTTKGSLLLLCLGLCASPLLIVSLFNVTLFCGRYKRLAPKLSAIDFGVAPSLLKLGVMFFICQISLMIRTQMANFLILRYYGAEEVTNYNISTRYFEVLTMIWGILMTPVWAAVTDAITKGEMTWIKNALTKFSKALLAISILALIMLTASDIVYDLWLGGKIKIPFILSFFVMLFQISSMFSSLFVQTLNGAGVLKTQTYISIISPLIFLFSLYIMIDLGWGVYSIPIASIIANVNGLIVAPIQCKNLFFNKK